MAALRCCSRSLSTYLRCGKDLKGTKKVEQFATQLWHNLVLVFTIWLGWKWVKLTNLSSAEAWPLIWLSISWKGIFFSYGFGNCNSKPISAFRGTAVRQKVMIPHLIKSMRCCLPCSVWILYRWAYKMGNRDDSKHIGNRQSSEKKKSEVSNINMTFMFLWCEDYICVQLEMQVLN